MCIRDRYMLVKLLTDQSRNLCVVGDDDQSIYGWRGADIHNILDFEKDYPDATVIKLEQNYRSTANILDAANQVIAHNSGRKEKKLWTEQGEGDPIRLFDAGDEREEAAWVADRIRQLNRHGEPYGNMAILYRTNAQSNAVENAFKRSGMKDITIKLYPEGRHEMLNERNKDEVYQDVLTWLER